MLGQRLAVKGSRIKLRDARLMDTEMASFGLFAGPGSIWFERWGRLFRALVAETSGCDGWIKAIRNDFVLTCDKVQILPRNQGPISCWKLDPQSFDRKRSVMY